MKTFANWAEEIAQVSELSEYQNATIVITDPSALTSSYSFDDNEYTVSGDDEVYAGPARVQPLRGAQSIGFASMQDISSSKTITVQIPGGEVDLIRRGFQLKVTDGGRNPALEQYLFTVVADVNSSHMASHTFECVVNVEMDPQWTVE
jgi:hypothetical protein